jgi:hypothetical protein
MREATSMRTANGWSWLLAVTLTLAAVTLALPSLAAAAKAPAHPTTAHLTTAHSTTGGSAEGIVQSVSAKAIVLRQLDGSTVGVPVGPGTHVFVNGKNASLRDVKRGFVASVTLKPGKPATLRAIDPAAQQAGAGAKGPKKAKLPHPS